MTDRIEYTFDMDGFVDEIRYYRSLTEIDTDNPPLPTALIDSSDRGYVDDSITPGEVYHVVFSSIKNGIEKFSDELVVNTMTDPHIGNVVLLVNADNGFINVINDSAINANENTIVSAVAADILPKFDSENFFHINRKQLTANLISSLGSVFTVEIVGFPNFSNSLNWANWFIVGDSYCVKNNNLSQLTFGRTGKTPTYDSGAKAVTVRKSIHACIMSNGTNIAMFIDGVLVRTYAYSASAIANVLFHGDFSSYVEAIRVTKEVARYDMNGFMPPSKFPTI